MEQTEPSTAIQRLSPERTILVTVGGDRPNAMPANWCTRTSHDPPMLAVSVGHERYTHELLEQHDAFGIVLPGDHHREAVRAWGEESGRDADKFERSDVTVEVGETGVPLLAGAAANFECSADGRLETGDHTLFAGEIVAAHVDPSVQRSLYDRGVSDANERFVALGPGDLADRSP